jgi:tRNA(Phe) wybutosine-synthesizing methylase Tyw3
MLGFSPKFIIYSGMDIFHVGCEDVKKQQRLLKMAQAGLKVHLRK